MTVCLMWIPICGFIYLVSFIAWLATLSSFTCGPLHRHKRTDMNSRYCERLPARVTALSLRRDFTFNSTTFNYFSPFLDQGCWRTEAAFVVKRMCTATLCRPGNAILHIYVLLHLGFYTMYCVWVSMSWSRDIRYKGITNVNNTTMYCNCTVILVQKNCT